MEAHLLFKPFSRQQNLCSLFFYFFPSPWQGNRRLESYDVSTGLRFCQVERNTNKYLV